MSFNAKNLSYELKEPTFLRKLKNQYGSGDLQRQEHPVARPKKPRGVDDDDDDQPTYLDEESHNTVTKAEYDALLQASAQGLSALEDETAPQLEEALKLKHATVATDSSLRTPKRMEKLADVGSRKKRKAVKVVGEDGEAGRMEEAGKEPRNPVARPRKKAKAVKLFFHDEEDL